MEHIEQFFRLMETEMAVTLATASQGRVTMRLVSPVRHGDEILLFTDPHSLKYCQLQDAPNCCIAAGPYFAECRARFLGATALPENQPLRAVYAAKFPDAFDPDVAFGGAGAEFLLLTPHRLTGWVSEEGASEGFPTVPLDIPLG